MINKLVAEYYAEHFLGAPFLLIGILNVTYVALGYLLECSACLLLGLGIDVAGAKHPVLEE